MRKRVYYTLFAITLAAFAFALLQPEFVMRLYVNALPEPSMENHGGTSVVSIEKLDADVDSENTDDSDQTEFSDTSEKPYDISGISFDVQVPINQTEEFKIIHNEPQAEIASNRLIVPSMGVDADVIMSNTEDALKKGLWHIPGSATPGTNGNIVIAAHRWLYKPPSNKTFYLIDKVSVGDPIYYDYEGIRYTYRVTETEIVQPDDVGILSQSENKLTLFTCHPLFSTKQRIVITAELESVS